MKKIKRIKCGCGKWATIGKYSDGFEDYYCKSCDITFYKDKNGKVIITS
jgi:transposase-like protein